MGVLGIDGIEQEVVVGRGAFGVVHRAWQPGLRRDVAVKVLVGAYDEAALRRFERECAAVGSLSQEPGILTVHAVGRTADGSPYLVMPFVEGGTLADRLAEGPLPVDEVVRCGVAVGRALAAAHRRGVLHLDVKPANVLVDGWGGWHLTDFGIARFIDAEQAGQTATTAGTPGYAGPEIFDGRGPSVASDVYGLGSTLHALAGGRAPFSAAAAGGLQGLLRQIASEAPPDLRPSGVPDDLCLVIERAMAKEPADRFATVEELVEALEAVGAGLGLSLEAGRRMRPAAVRPQGGGAPAPSETRVEDDPAAARLETRVEDDEAAGHATVVEAAPARAAPSPPTARERRPTRSAEAAPVAPAPAEPSAGSDAGEAADDVTPTPSAVTEGPATGTTDAAPAPAPPPPSPPPAFGTADLVRFGIVMALVAGLVVVGVTQLRGDGGGPDLAVLELPADASMPELVELDRISLAGIAELLRRPDASVGERQESCRATLTELEEDAPAVEVRREIAGRPTDERLALTALHDAWIGFWEGCASDTSWDLRESHGAVEDAKDAVGGLAVTSSGGDAP